VKKAESNKEQNSSFITNSIKTLITLLAASLTCEGLYRLGIEDQNTILVMVMALFIIAAITDRYWYGLAATFIGVVVYDFLVTDPRLGFSITLGFPITLSIMLLVSLATSAITSNIKQQAKNAKEKEQRANLLYVISVSLLWR
jgi:two-component system sensor histidine kinase KdpD